MYISIKSKTMLDRIKRNRPYFEDFITRSIYHSNAIEGNTMSYAETYSILFNDNSMKVHSTPREIYEVINLKYAFHYILENLGKELSIDMIKQIGILINKNINDITGFRTTNVYIRGAEHIPPDPAYVTSMLAELLYRYGKDKTENIFYSTAEFHIEFERIHPFSDGNGRTGRLLITKELLEQGEAPVIIPFEERSNYMNMLAKQDVISLSNLLKQLNKEEKARMCRFGIIY